MVILKMTMATRTISAVFALLLGGSLALSNKGWCDNLNDCDITHIICSRSLTSGRDVKQKMYKNEEEGGVGLLVPRAIFSQLAVDADWHSTRTRLHLNGGVERASERRMNKSSPSFPVDERNAATAAALSLFAKSLPSSHSCSLVISLSPISLFA